MLPGVLQHEDCVLGVIDVQERLLPHIANQDQVLKGCATLVQAARKLNIPTLLTEQYPKGLGHTVPELAALLEGVQPIEKSSFSCLGAGPFDETMIHLGRKTLVLCGIESHVCVIQTALDALEAGLRVVIVADAVGSRSPENHRLALERMRHCRIEIVSIEMALMEWLRDSAHPAFKDIQKLIK